MIDPVYFNPHHPALEIWLLKCSPHPLIVTEAAKSLIVAVSQPCPTLCDPMDFSAPGFLVLHHLLELAQTHFQCYSQWCYPTISSSVVPSSSCLQSFPSGSFLLSQLRDYPILTFPFPTSDTFRGFMCATETLYITALFAANKWYSGRKYWVVSGGQFWGGLNQLVYAGQEVIVETGHGTNDWAKFERSTSRLYIVTLLT